MTEEVISKMLDHHNSDLDDRIKVALDGMHQHIIEPGNKYQVADEAAG
jgi:hypothetical protein